MKLLKKKFIKDQNSKYINLTDFDKNELVTKHYKKTLELWGKGNHVSNKLKHDGGNTHIEKLIEIFGKKISK